MALQEAWTTRAASYAWLHVKAGALLVVPWQLAHDHGALSPVVSLWDVRVGLIVAAWVVMALLVRWMWRAAAWQGLGPTRRFFIGLVLVCVPYAPASHVRFRCVVLMRPPVAVAVAVVVAVAVRYRCCTTRGAWSPRNCGCGCAWQGRRKVAAWTLLGHAVCAVECVSAEAGSASRPPSLAADHVHGAAGMHPCFHRASWGGVCGVGRCGML